MEFRMLGPLEAWHNNTPVSLGDQQQRFILVVLLLHANKPVSPERLTETVWPDNPERKTLVRGYINKLRKAFERTDASIDRTPTGYVLRVDEDHIDSVRFDRLREEAARAVRNNDQRKAVELLRAAVVLWRGRFLDDIDIDRVGGAGVISPAESYPDTLGDLAELELQVGDHRSARDRMRRALQTDPAHQRYAELLMRALIVGGDGVSAIRVYQRAREALAQAGFEPGSVLRKLAARAEQGEPVSSLPIRPGKFTGRSGELQKIESAAAGAGQRRAVWISGAPGVGKTGLAVEAAHRLRDRFPDGQLLVRLNGFTPNVAPMSVSDALTQLLTDLGVPVEQIPDTVGRKATVYQSHLYGTKTLVVLDNAVSPAQIRPLLPETPGCFAVVTSRRMGQPDISEHLRLGPLPQQDATELFHRLTDKFRGARPADVAGLVKRCGYLPMPITVAAATLRRHDRWSLEHLLALMDEEGPWRLAGAAAVHASYQLLDDRQQEVFRLFGHLPGPHVDLVAAAALVGHDVSETRKLLDDLHEVCLLEEIAPDRYQMLDSIKEFAAFEPAPEHALARLLDFYLVTLANAASTAYPFDHAAQPSVDRESPLSLRFTEAGAAQAWITAELDNVVAAIQHSATNALPGHAWQLAVLVWRHFNTANRFEDWIATLELAKETTDSYGQAHVLLRLAIAHDRRGLHTKALELAQQALPHWTGLGDVHGEAATLCTIAICTMKLGSHLEAMRQFEAALEKYEQCGDLRGQAHALSQLGYLNEQHHQYEAALRRQEKSVRILRQIGHLRGLAYSLDNLGAIQQHLGLLDEAIPNHVEAHELAVRLDDSCAAAYALTNLADAYRLTGRFTEAVHHLKQASKAAAGVDDADLKATMFRVRAATASGGGDQVAALRLYESLLGLATDTGNRTYRAYGEIGVAQSMHALGRHSDAVAHWDAASEAFAELGQPEAEEVRTERAALTCACGQR